MSLCSHIVAHFVNAYNIAYVAVPARLVELGVLAAGKEPPTPWYSYFLISLLFLFSIEVFFRQFGFLTLAGWTGVVITLALILMLSTAVKMVRSTDSSFTNSLIYIYPNFSYRYSSLSLSIQNHRLTLSHLSHCRVS